MLTPDDIKFLRQNRFPVARQSRGRRVPEYKIADMRRRAAAGELLMDIAIEHNVDRKTVQRHVQGVVRAHHQCGRPRSFDYRRAVDLARQTSTATAAERLQVSVRAIQRARRAVREGRV